MSLHFRRPSRASRSLETDRAIDGLLEEMHELRLTLAADLTAAAGAADAGADRVARDIIDADQRELARFARVANINLERLSGSPAREPVRPVRPAKSAAWRRRATLALPVVPVVGAMAFSAAAATGVLPLPGTSHSSRPAVQQAPSAGPVTTTFRQLEDVLNGDPSASQVIAAASKLHQQLRHLIATSPNNPTQVAEIAQLLRMEQSLVMRAQPPGAEVVLDATRKLARRLVSTVPSLVTPSVAPTLVPQPSAPHRPRHHTTAPTTAPTPAPTKDASAPPTQPSSKPSSSPSPSQSPFPTIPNG